MPKVQVTAIFEVYVHKSVDLRNMADEVMGDLDRYFEGEAENIRVDVIPMPQQGAPELSEEELLAQMERDAHPFANLPEGTHVFPPEHPLRELEDGQ